MTEEDNGRFKQTQKAYDRHRFKVPGLRNVALTFPYYHDGTRETLSEAVDDMPASRSAGNSAHRTVTISWLSSVR